MHSVADDSPRRRRRLIGVIGIAGLSSLLISVGVILHLEETGASTNPVSVISMFAGLVGVIIAAWQLVVGMPAPPAASQNATQQLDNAAARLAENLVAQWEREADLRSLRMPSPLQVPWSATKRAVSVTPNEVLRTSTGKTPISLKLQGRLDETMALFDELPRHQLVVLGDPGAGKSVLAILLTLELLRRIRPGDPIPVLLPLLSWNPAVKKLEDWISDRLGTDYPVLRDAALFGADAPERLTVQGRILAVLDGLDEMPTSARPLAIAEISRVWGGRPLILTCRTAEFELAVKDGRPVAGAAVIELEPVPIDDRLAYFREGEAVGQSRWDKVAAAMRGGTDRELDEALSTPLMVSLARVVYQDDDPGEILDRKRFPDRHAIEDRLLDALLPIAYGARTSHASSIVASTRMRNRWSEAQARRWLTFLAQDLTRRSTRDIAWWELYRSVPWKVARIVFVLLIAVWGFVLAASLTIIAVSLSASLLIAPLVGIASGLTAMIPAFVGSIPDLPVDFHVHVGFGGYKSTRNEAIGIAISGALVPGIGVGLLTSFAVDPILGLLAGGVCGILGALVVGTVRWSRHTAWTTAPTPAVVLSADRRTTLIHWAVAGALLGVAVGVILGRGHGTAVSLSTGLLTAVIFGWGVSSGTAYAWFVTTRLWLCLRGQLPWRTMAFLEDAHRRGVLRQFGAVYQFRHGRLQDRLAEDTTGELFTCFK